MKEWQFNSEYRVLLENQKTLAEVNEPLERKRVHFIREIISVYDGILASFKDQEFTTEQEKRLAAFRLVNTEEFTAKVARLKAQISAFDDLDDLDDLVDHPDFRSVASGDADEPNDTSIEAVRDRRYEGVILELQQQLGIQSSTDTASVELPAQNNVSSSFFLQMLLDWRFQVFCTALLLAASAGLAISSFGIGAIALPVLAVQACKAGAAFGLGGLTMSAVGSFFKPATGEQVATNGSHELDVRPI